MAATAQSHRELGCYLMAGAAADPAEVLTEARRAEDLGPGTTFISEHFNVKEAVALSGAATATTSSIDIATAAAQFDLGVDGVMLHDCSPDELEPVVAAYSEEARRDDRG